MMSMFSLLKMKWAKVLARDLNWKNLTNIWVTGELRNGKM